MIRWTLSLVLCLQNQRMIAMLKTLMAQLEAQKLDATRLQQERADSARELHETRKLLSHHR